MPQVPARDPQAHIGAAFHERFPTWAALRSHIDGAARAPEYGPDRALLQILSADFASRLLAVHAHDWLLFGSLALPARTSTEDPWPSDFLPAADSAVHPAYAMAREAFDLDLSALDVERPGPGFGEVLREAVWAVSGMLDERADRGVGLGGLVHYAADVEIHPTGKVMGAIHAQPLAPGGRPADDPIRLEIDIKPPDRVRLLGPPEVGTRSLVGLDLPGFAPPAPPIYPTASQLADKISLIAGPPPDSARRSGTAPWHRFKDLFDLYYMIKTCRVDGDEVRSAVLRNARDRFGWDGLPGPFRVHDTMPDGTVIPWREQVEAMRAQQPQLARYPDFDRMQDAVADFAAGLTGSAQMWIPGQGWGARPAPALTLDEAPPPARSSAAAAAWLERYRSAVVALAGGAAVSAQQREQLQAAAQEAPQVVAAAFPAADTAARRAAEATVGVLAAVVAQRPGSAPVVLMTDADLVRSLQRLDGTPPTGPNRPLVQRLAAEQERRRGLPPEQQHAEQQVRAQVLNQRRPQQRTPRRAAPEQGRGHGLGQ